jgi:hypothetical protein
MRWQKTGNSYRLGFSISTAAALSLNVEIGWKLWEMYLIYCIVPSFQERKNTKGFVSSLFVQHSIVQYIALVLERLCLTKGDLYHHWYAI